MELRILKALFISLLLFSFASPLLAEENKVPKVTGEEKATSTSSLMGNEEKNKFPIKITSDRLISDNKTKIITFTGNVKAVREDLVMLADQIEILQDTGKNGLNMIVARGNVRINQKGKYATGEKAVYFEEFKKIVLTGNPRSWEDKNEITGEEMTFYLEEDRLVVKQSQQEQVNVIFYPKKKQ